MIYKHNGCIITDVGGKWLTGGGTPVDPYNPLHLPFNTVRVRTNDGEPPLKIEGVAGATYNTATLVSGTSDVYDVFKWGHSFNYMFNGSGNVVEVLGANTRGINDMHAMFNTCTNLTTIPLFDTSSVTGFDYMFAGCSSLTSVPSFDTSNATNMASMFAYCSSITSVPLFDTSKVTSMDNMFLGCTSLTLVSLFNTTNVTAMFDMFRNCSSLTSIPLFNTSSVRNTVRMCYGCRNVESGALALYQQLSTQTNPPSDHADTFYNCGINTQSGAAELAQIPSSWGGTGV